MTGLRVSSTLRRILCAAVVLGSASTLAMTSPALSQEAGHGGGKSGASSSHTESGHSGGGCSGGCSGGEEDAGHGGKGGSQKSGGRKGGTGDYSHGGGRAGGVVGHIFDQQETGHKDADANRGPHPGGNPAEKNDKTKDGTEGKPH